MTCSYRFSGKVALVTGAAQGLGRAVALRLIAEGAAVMLVDQSPLVHEVRAEAACSSPVLTLEADLTQFAGFTGVVAQTLAAFARLDILVNNGGGGSSAKPCAEYTVAEIEQDIYHSLFPALWGCRAVLPAMRQQGGGAIINVSPVARRGARRVPYAVASGGVNALTTALASKYAAQNIRVNAVAPGRASGAARRGPRRPQPLGAPDLRWPPPGAAQTTLLSPVKHYSTMEEQCAAILFLASDDASYLTGVTLPVAGSLG